MDFKYVKRLWRESRFSNLFPFPSLMFYPPTYFIPSFSLIHLPPSSLSLLPSPFLLLTTLFKFTSSGYLPLMFLTRSSRVFHSFRHYSEINHGKRNASEAHQRGGEPPKALPTPGHRSRRPTARARKWRQTGSSQIRLHGHCVSFDSTSIYWITWRACSVICNCIIHEINYAIFKT